jgi:LacI family transcriptional regulator
MAEQRGKTLKDLAKATGLSVSGVSYALRRHPSIPAATVEKVVRAAEQIGYRMDLRVASLMSNIRRNRPSKEREVLAFVWVGISRKERDALGYFQIIYEATRLRAEQAGCSLQEFWADDPGMSQARLCGILRSRGIVGVIFSPPVHGMTIHFDWEWEHFACAIIGNTDWRPALHRAALHHYRAMWHAMERLRCEGYQRPAVLLSADIHGRLHGVHYAAFLVNHPSPELAINLAKISVPGDYAKLKSWPAALEPDALIIGWYTYPTMTRALRKLAPKAKRVVTLDWYPQSGLPGIDQCNTVIAASAVDLVVAQLHRNERGVPEHPKTTLIDGVWRE